MKDAAERYQLAIYNVPFDASSPHNYAVWQGFKLCRILALELESRERKALQQRDDTMESLRRVVPLKEEAESRIEILEAEILKRDEKIRELEKRLSGKRLLLSQLSREDW